MVSIFASVRAWWMKRGPLYLWAAPIVAIAGASPVLGMFALVLTAPPVGHATWHAYRDLIAD